MKKIILFLCLFVILTACSHNNDDVAISDAQTCLNQSTPANATQCIAKVNGLTSPSSYLIRCSAYLIQEQINSSARIGSVINSLKSGSSTSDTTTVLAALSFRNSGPDIATNYSVCQTTFNYCGLSGDTGLQLLSNLSLIATTALNFSSVVNTTNPSSTDIQNAIVQAQSSSSAQQSIGLAAISAAQNNCTNPSQNFQVVCTSIQQAITNAGGTGNSQSVGCNLLKIYAGSGSCP